MKKNLLLVSWVILMCLSVTGNAQTYPITHLSGTQTIAGVNVTVTPTAAGTSNISYCGADPYWIGYNDTPGSYTFTFPAPKNVTVRVTAMNSNEIISFVVNGTPYTLTAANIATYLGTCNQTQASIVPGGNLGAPGAPLQPGSGAEINISNVTTIEVHANGEEAGSVFSITFEHFSVYNNSPICVGDSLKLFVSPGIPGATYAWTGPGGFSSNVQSPVIPVSTPAHEGMYNVSVTTPGNTFTGSTYATILPTPVTTIIYPDPLCSGKDLVLSDTTTLPDVRYQWSGPNGFTDTTANPLIPDVQQLHSGVYTLTTTVGECSYETAVTVNVSEPAQNSFSKVICSNEPFYFNGNQLTSPGTYTGTFIAASGCDSVVTVDLGILPSPEVTVSVNQTGPFCMGDSVVLQADGAASYEWYNNDQLLAEKDASVHIELPYASNAILLAGAADNGCKDSVTSLMHTEPCCEMFVPNVFSPNSDGLNDIFYPQSIGHFRSYLLSIYNRWGQLVFKSYDIGKGWDGTINGAAADGGNYFYNISGECLEATKLKRKGDLLLVR